MFNEHSLQKSGYSAGIALGMVVLLATTACGNFLVRSSDDVFNGVDSVREWRPDVDNTVSIGEIANIGDLTFSVGAVRATDGRNERIPAPAPPVGQIYLLADVLMENLGLERVYVASRMQISLLDSEGETQEWALLPGSTGSIDGRIDPGREKKGELAWVVDDDANGLMMMFGGTAFILGDVSGYRSGSPDNQLTSMKQ